MVGEKCFVFYLFYGYGGNVGIWFGIKLELFWIVDKEGIIFVCLDGKNSWYWDSFLNKEYCYEIFVLKELVNYIDKNFIMKVERGGCVVIGLSMGGYGSLWLFICYKDVFGGGGSMSGGLDICLFFNNWEMKK